MPTLSPQLLRSRIGKVCVAVTGATTAEVIEKATSVIKEHTFIEVRFDYLDKPMLALPGLKTLLSENPTATAIATLRRKETGGRFTGTPSDELTFLCKAALSGFQIIDLSLESAEALKPAELSKLRDTGVSLIISHHDFAVTKDLDGIYDRILRFSPDFIKIVPTAKTLSDNLTLLDFIERKNESSNIIGISMGEAGIISRVLGVRAGSAFTFAAATAGEETAPGQIAARTLSDTYRIEELDAATKVYGVAGNPVRHSLSPVMLNAAFRRETLNSVYLGLQTNKIDDLLKLVQEIPIQGLSITMPFKQEIMPHLERTDPLSAKIGACNTVLRAQDGKLYGFNTDVAGILAPLEKRMSLKGSRILVLGAGGAARAAVFGLREKGADVFILNRTPETAQKLARQSQSKAIKKEAIAKSQFDVILNATPIGMTGFKGAPLLDAGDLNTKLVFDLVYSPLETPLIRMARQANIPIITGVEMFVQQGARQFEIWTGKPAPEEEMLRVVLHALKQQAEASALQSVTPKKPAEIADQDSAPPARPARKAPVPPKKKAASRA